MIGGISGEGMLFLVVAIAYWAVLVAAALFLLWTLYLLNTYLRLRIPQLREERRAVPGHVPPAGSRPPPCSPGSSGGSAAAGP